MRRPVGVSARDQLEREVCPHGLSPTFCAACAYYIPPQEHR